MMFFCYFKGNNHVSKLKVSHSFCSSSYGAELWDLCNVSVNNLVERTVLRTMCHVAERFEICLVA